MSPEDFDVEFCDEKRNYPLACENCFGKPGSLNFQKKSSRLRQESTVHSPSCEATFDLDSVNLS